MRYDRIVIGYHGCDADVAKRLLDGDEFVSSVNDYDWLGTGVYFWEYGADRAYRFALAQKKRAKLTTPAVIGALIQLGKCFDLLDTRFTDDLGQAFERFRSSMLAAEIPLPKNQGKTPDRSANSTVRFSIGTWLRPHKSGNRTTPFALASSKDHQRILALASWPKRTSSSPCATRLASSACSAPY